MVIMSITRDSSRKVEQPSRCSLASEAVLDIVRGIRVAMKDMIIRSYDHRARYVMTITARAKRSLGSLRMFENRASETLRGSDMVARSVGDNPRNDDSRSDDGTKADLHQDLDRQDNHT